MNRYCAAILALGVILNLHSQPANAADPVWCVNCGTEYTQLYNKALMIKQYAQQAQQLKAEIGQYKDMMLNSHGLSQHLWGKATQDFDQLMQLMGKSRALSYSAGNLDGQFARRYATYDDYLNRSMGNGDWRSKYAQWSQEGSDNALYTLKGLGLQAAQLRDDQALQQRLQTMAASAQGRMQALQVANMLAAQNADQLMKLRELMMMQLQLQANYIALQEDKTAAQEGAGKQYFKIHKANLNGERF